MQKRAAKIKPLEAVLLVVVIVGAAGYFGYITIPGLTPGSGVGIGTQTHTSANTAAQGCTYNPIQSELTSANGQTVTASRVATYQPNAAGSWTKLPSASGSLTQNALNTASAYTTLPVYQTYSGTQVYNSTVTISSGAQPATSALSVTCATPAGSSNNVPTIQAIATVYTGPSAGTTATSGVENVINSQISQTNSLPAAFPTSAPVTWTDYVQVFGANNAFGLSSTVAASTNLPISNYNAGGVQQNSGIVSFFAYAIVAFNQTAIQFSAPGAVPLTLHGASGSIAFLVPLNSNGICPASGVGTTNPCIGSSFSFSVLETIGATSHHADMVVQIVDNTQAAYIQSYYNTPAVTSYPAAANHYGIATGFSGLVPPSASNAPAPLTEQYSAAILTY